MHNSDDSVACYKARLVARGFTHTYGIYYDQTLAPVVKIFTYVHVPLSFAANQGWPLYQLDMKNTFLHERLAEEVYIWVFLLPSCLRGGIRRRYVISKNLSMA